jgi:hypothetical protein
LIETIRSPGFKNVARVLLIAAIPEAKLVAA